MPHFFISSNTVNDRTIEISDKNIHKHVAKSLRAKIGENLLLIDENEIQYEVRITEITSSSIKVEILNRYKSNRKLDFKLYLAQSPLKSDAQSLIIEKATELGVAGIYPIYTDNCVLKKEVINKKIPKWQITMQEASKQCERANIPECFELTTIKKLVQSEFFDRIVVFLEREAQIYAKAYLRTKPPLKNEVILVIIGPEGGFSQKEIEYFKDQKLPTLSLGDLILKAETATAVALGNIVYEVKGET